METENRFLLTVFLRIPIGATLFVTFFVFNRFDPGCIPITASERRFETYIWLYVPGAVKAIVIDGG